MTTLFSQSTIPNDGGNSQSTLNSGNQPSWFQNPKKRSIPNHLVPKKKTGFQISSSTTSKNSKKNVVSSSSSSNQFNLLSFGSQQRKNLSQGGILDRANSVGTLYDTTSGELTKYDETLNETVNDEFPLYSNNDDVPSSRSLYDLNDEILLSLNKPVQHADSFINKDPKKFSNVFNLKDLEASETKPQERIKSVNPLSNGESAILVFGYPESMSTQVIQHFKEYGNILENFEANQPKRSLLHSNKENNKIVPIFSGKSWVKITFDNPASALDALQENGYVFNGVLLGVTPYTKDLIEKLQKRKLTENEDIGGGIDLSLTASRPNKEIENELTNQSSSYITKLDIKDGSNLFLKAQEGGNDSVKLGNEKKVDERLGLFGNIFKYIFGFNEL